jgi:tetraacyldisaccharide 4'-kinase
MEHPETQVILLDDAYQHRTVTPDLNILLTQFDAPFYKDHVLPSGMLRETRGGATRANIVVVTKCPANFSFNERNEIKAQVEKYTKEDTPVFFSEIRYGLPKALIPEHAFTGKVILFAGLADINPLVRYVEETFEVIEVKEFSDHYSYTLKDIEELSAKAKQLNASLLTTEKDVAKLRSKDFLSLVEKVGLFYLPISVQFLFTEGMQFDSLIREAIADKYEPEEEPSDVEG